MPPADALSPEAAAAMAAVVNLRQHQMRLNSMNQSNHDDVSSFGLHSNKDGPCEGISMPKMGSTSTSSNSDMGFSMPRLASPAMPDIRALGGLSGLQLIQNFGRNSEFALNNNKRSGNSTPTHTEIKSSSECSSRNDSTSKDLINGGRYQKTNEKNNNTNISNSNKNLRSTESTSSVDRNHSPADSIQDLSINSPSDKQTRYPIDDFESSVELINGLPFKPTLSEFLNSSPIANQQLFADDLSEFESTALNSPGRTTAKESDGKVKTEPPSYTDSRDD